MAGLLAVKDCMVGNKIDTKLTRIRLSCEPILRYLCSGSKMRANIS